MDKNKCMLPPASPSSSQVFKIEPALLPRPLTDEEEAELEARIRLTEKAKARTVRPGRGRS